MFDQFNRIELQPVPFLYNFHTTVDVLRLDLLHPVVSGNKWFKLSRYVEEAREKKKTTLLTFGGAYSNHIVATAAAAQLQGFRSAGIIRGEAPAHFSPTLQDAMNFGMQLFFISRTDYQQKLFPNDVYTNYGADELYVVPEGGYGEKGAEGAADILHHASHDYTHILAAAGTGTTVAGLASAAAPHQRVIGIPVLKNNFTLAEEIGKLLPEQDRQQILLVHDYHFGGYAKKTEELIRFMNLLYTETAIPTDFVYTGKLFFAVHDLLKKNYFPPGSKLLVIHSGGLQGNRSLPKGTLIF